MALAQTWKQNKQAFRDPILAARFIRRNLSSTGVQNRWRHSNHRLRRSKMPWNCQSALLSEPARLPNISLYPLNDGSQKLLNISLTDQEMGS